MFARRGTPIDDAQTISRARVVHDRMLRRRITSLCSAFILFIVVSRNLQLENTAAH
jgi:hypothetical protein